MSRIDTTSNAQFLMSGIDTGMSLVARALAAKRQQELDDQSEQRQRAQDQRQADQDALSESWRNREWTRQEKQDKAAENQRGFANFLQLSNYLSSQQESQRQAKREEEQSASDKAASQALLESHLNGASITNDSGESMLVPEQAQRVSPSTVQSLRQLPFAQLQAVLEAMRADQERQAQAAATQRLGGFAKDVVRANPNIFADSSTKALVQLLADSNPDAAVRMVADATDKYAQAQDVASQHTALAHLTAQEFANGDLEAFAQFQALAPEQLVQVRKQLETRRVLEQRQALSVLESRLGFAQEDHENALKAAQSATGAGARKEAQQAVSATGLALQRARNEYLTAMEGNAVPAQPARTAQPADAAPSPAPSIGAAVTALLADMDERGTTLLLSGREREEAALQHLIDALDDRRFAHLSIDEKSAVLEEAMRQFTDSGD